LARRPEYPDSQGRLGYDLLVVHDRDQTFPAPDSQSRFDRIARAGSLQDRKIDIKCGAFAWLEMHVNKTGVLADDVVYHGQAEAGPFFSVTVSLPPW